MISNWKKFLESLSSEIDWQAFSEEISRELGKYKIWTEGFWQRIHDLSYPFSVSEYMTLSKKLSVLSYGSTPIRFSDFKIGGKLVYEEISSEPGYVWIIKKISDRLGGGAKMCDMGCGNGLVTLYSQKLGLDAIGIEGQKRLEKIHKELGIKVYYGDFFKMGLSVLQDRDIIYLYQPVRSTKSSIELLDRIYNNTKDDVVILYQTFGRVLDRIKMYDKFNYFILEYKKLPEGWAESSSVTLLLTKKSAQAPI